MEVEDKVIYLLEMKGLTFGEVGILTSIHEPNEHNKEAWGVVSYAEAYKDKKCKIYCHSAKLTELKKAEDGL